MNAGDRLIAAAKEMRQMVAAGVIARAIMAERERCARIAEAHVPDDCHRDDLYRWSFTADQIAAAIRKGQG